MGKGPINRLQQNNGGDLYLTCHSFRSRNGVQSHGWLSRFYFRSKGDINEKEQVQTGRKSVQFICSVLDAYPI